ncbi:MAG: hypothetical protein NC211_08920 [Alistipes senegalensis]|nr:hypothetical protein [Oxalobacter formigenes]MCM1281929.1 hypothetical protein [Alistipes senegalensis]
MKKIIPVILLSLALSSCDNQPKAEKEQELNPGRLHFASILVLDDLITNGVQSDFVSLSPVPLVNPEDTVTAESILEDFRRDFIDAHDKYPLRLSEGLSITWNLDYDADAQYGISFHKEDRSKNTVFAGKLSLRFDPEYYSTSPYPTYSKDSDATVICHEFTSATERKNDYLVWVEVAFDRCMAATDYYASVRNQLKNQQSPLKERLGNIYAGNEETSSEIAGKLSAYYQAGNAFPPDSVCLTGEREECLSNLKNEIIRKYENTPFPETENLKIRISDKLPGKKPETSRPDAIAISTDIEIKEETDQAAEKTVQPPVSVPAPEQTAPGVRTDSTQKTTDPAI